MPKPGWQPFSLCGVSATEIGADLRPFDSVAGVDYDAFDCLHGSSLSPARPNQERGERAKCVVGRGWGTSDCLASLESLVEHIQGQSHSGAGHSTWYMEPEVPPPNHAGRGTSLLPSVLLPAPWHRLLGRLGFPASDHPAEYHGPQDAFMVN